MRRLPLIVAVAVAFLALSALLARHLSFEGREREVVLAALRAQPRAAGGVELLRLDSATAYSLGPARGPSRIAWRRPSTDETFVQCADVERTGTVLTARRVVLRGLGEPIGLEASCP